MSDDLQVEVTETGVILNGMLTDDPEIIATIKANSADPDGDLADGLSKVMNAGAKEITRLYSLFPTAQADGTQPKALFELAKNFGDKNAPAAYDLIMRKHGKVELTEVQNVIRTLSASERGFLWRT